MLRCTCLRGWLHYWPSSTNSFFSSSRLSPRCCCCASVSLWVRRSWTVAAAVVRSVSQWLPGPTPPPQAPPAQRVSSRALWRCLPPSFLIKQRTAPPSWPLAHQAEEDSCSPVLHIGFLSHRTLVWQW